MVTRRGEVCSARMKNTSRKKLALRREAVRQLSDALSLRACGAGLQTPEPTYATDCFNTCGGPALCAGLER